MFGKQLPPTPVLILNDGINSSPKPFSRHPNSKFCTPPSILPFPFFSRQCLGGLGYIRSHLSLSGHGASFAWLQPIASFHLQGSWRRAGFVRQKRRQQPKGSRQFPSQLPVTSPWLLLKQPVLLLIPVKAMAAEDV